MRPAPATDIAPWLARATWSHPLPSVLIAALAKPFDGEHILAMELAAGEALADRFMERVKHGVKS